MSRSFSQDRQYKYVQRLRKQEGLGTPTCNFSRWHRHFHPETERKVRQAPQIIGYLVSLWWDLRLKTHDGNRFGDELTRLTALCGRLGGLINTEIRIATRDQPDLELRSDGYFVRVVASRV